VSQKRKLFCQNVLVSPPTLLVGVRLALNLFCARSGIEQSFPVEG
jgi:hypothetical protein